ncbi:MAG TPA: DUF1566 domain-containing protein [Pyrinomonadaceae bacterium]
MQSEASNNERLVVHGDGTVTDSETGLMWTTSTFGKNLYGVIREMPRNKDIDANMKGFTWREATEIFGRGRKRGRGEVKPGLSSDTYEDYEFAKTCPVTIGNYDDWRLPTVEESKTLIHESHPVVNSITSVNTKVFGNTPDLWTATYSYFEVEHCAWSMHGGYTVDGQAYCSDPKCVLLVRSGAAFNASAAVSSQGRKSRRRNWFGGLFRTD